MSRIDALIADLQGEGTVDSQGGFTLDRDKARAKMRQFQLADPREYLLHLIRAAHHQGATRIDVEVDADDMHLRFDGAAFTERDFEDLYDALFGGAGDKAMAGRRHLALGLNAALGLDPRRILVRSGGAQLVVVPEGDDDFGPLEPPIEGTWIHARDRVRFSNVFRFFQGLGGGLPEARLVRERCGFSAVPLTLNGAPVPSGRAAIEAQVVAFHAIDGAHGWAYGGPTEPGLPGALHVVAGGVRVCTVELPGALGFVGVASDTRLRTDVSQADVIRDAAFDEMMALARRASAGALRALIEADAAEAFLDAELAVVDWVTMDETYGADVALALRRRVHARTLAGAPVSLVDVDPSRPVEVVTLDFAERRAAVGPLPVDLRDAVVVEGPFAAAVAHQMVDRTPDLLGWLKRVEGERDFRRRRVEALALSGDFAARAPIAEGEWRGEVAVSPDDRGRGWITWVLDGCALASDRVDLVLPGLRVIIAGPLTPTPDYRAVVQDAAYDAAAAVIGDAVTRLMNALPRDQWGRGIALRWLEVAKGGAPGQQVARALTGGARSDDDGWLRALPTSTDPLAAMPLFETMQGEHRALAELAVQVAAGDPVACVGRTVEGPRVEPPIIWADTGERALLKAIFGRKAVTSGAAQLARARKIEAFEALPPRRLDLSFETATLASQARFTDGVIGLRRRAIAVPSGWFAARVQPFSRGRPLQVVELALPLPGVVGAVEVHDRALNVDLDGLEDASRFWLLTRLIPHLDALFTPGVRIGPARRFLRALIDLWVPTDAHHAAWIRWDDPEVYRAALRHGWRHGLKASTQDLARWSTDDVPRDAPEDPIREAILAPMLAATGTLAERLQRAYPRLAATRAFRAFAGPDASLDDVVAGVDAHGVVLHASRASVFPEGFGGVTLKTEHAQLERLARLVGPDAVERATSWKAEHALARAVAAAPPDPGGLPAGARAIVPIEEGEVGLVAPLDPQGTSAIQVVMAGRVVAVLEPSTRVPLVGRVAPGEAARMVLSRGALGVDDLTRVRVIDQATRAEDAVVRAALAEPQSPEGDALLRGVLAARARGQTQRGLLEDDAVARRIAERPLFALLDAEPVALTQIIDHRRRRAALSTTWDAAAPSPEDPSHWVLVLDDATQAVLEQVFTRPLPDYAEDLAERAAAQAFADKPVVAWALPEATCVVEVSDGPVRALVGWGLPTDALTVLRDGRRLGRATLALGIVGVGALAEDDALPPTPAWRTDPRLRRVQRLVASGVSALGEALAVADPPAARALIWRLLSAAFPSPAWIELYRWLSLRDSAREAQRHYHDALQAAAQGARYLLERLTRDCGERCPVTAEELMRTWPWPQSSAGDRILRGLLNHHWPLAGDPKAPPLARLAGHLGALGEAPWILSPGEGWLSMAGVARLTPADTARLALEPPQHAALDAIYTAWAAAEAAQRARAAADAQRAAQAALRQRQVEARKRAREATHARLLGEVEARASKAVASPTPPSAPAAEAPPTPTEPTPVEPSPAKPAPAEPAPAEPGPARLSPEAALIDRIITRLRAVQADHPRLLADVNLARLVADVEGPLATADDARFALNTRHPTAVAAMAGDPVAELMVVTAAYTALNLWLDDITDAHELQVIEHLLDLAAGASSRDPAPG